MFNNQVGFVFGYKVGNEASTYILEQYEEFIDKHPDFFYNIDTDMLIGIPVFICDPKEQGFSFSISDINEKLKNISECKVGCFNNFIAKIQAECVIGLPQLHFINIFI